jgi:dolichol-phosphate mannosyltransferase
MVTNNQTSFSISVIIPCFRVKKHLKEVIEGIPSYVDKIFIVDDKCPQNSGKVVEELRGKNLVQKSKIEILYLDSNRGVGGATTAGYQAALSQGYDILVKMDGDGQMDPAYLPRLLNPIITGHSDFTKGNRFYDLVSLKDMPLIRRIGNLGLTFFTKTASGYWSISDPTNGYTAVHSSVLKIMNLESLSKRYFFEISMLVQLNILRASAIDVPIPAKYGSESSSLSVFKSLIGFPPKLFMSFFKRLVWRYFVYDLNAVTILLVMGISLALFGVTFGTYHLYFGAVEQKFQSPGTVATALLPTLLGVQMLLQAILFDVTDCPTSPISKLVIDKIE